MIPNREALGLALLVLANLRPAGAQNTQRQFQPELDVYLEESDRLRFVFQNVYRIDCENQGNELYGLGGRGAAAGFPAELRQREDVFRSRFLTFRAGYRYITPLGNSSARAENRVLVEFTGRYPVPLKFVITDRSRVEFRFIHGQSFSMRYRNRLGVEHDLKLGIVVTPYLYSEFFYDTTVLRLERGTIHVRDAVPVRAALHRGTVCRAAE
jgi:hypothetical protein